MSAGGSAGARAVGLVVAAGDGQRLAAGVPKAFVELAGAPLLVHAARALASSGAVDGLVVVVAAGEEARAQRVLAAAGVPARRVCAGGSSRQASVARGLAHLDPADTVVAVHDAARPLATPALVARVVAALVPPVVAVAPGLGLTDTVKLVDRDGARVLRTLDRGELRAVQTPQVFARATLERAHAGADATATDDLALVEAAGGEVRLVEGERRNLKITYPEDLVFAEAVLAEGERT